MNRRSLTPEEQEEARRLTSLWEEYKAAVPGATQSWLAVASGLGTQGAVSQYLRGVIPLNLQALVSICRVIDADPYYVSPRLMNPLTGALPPPPNKVVPFKKQLAQPVTRVYEPPEEKRETPSRFGRVEVADPSDPRFTFIPKVRLRLTAGISGFAIDADNGSDESSTSVVRTDWILQKGYAPGSLIAIDVRGESMEPTFYEGDLVVLNTADTRPVDGGVFAFNYEGEPVVKRMARDAGEWWLTSDNPDQRKYPRKLCSGDACIIVGRIVRRETERF